MVSTKNAGPPSELWDIDEVADYFGTGRRYIYRLTSERRIRYMKIGRALRFDPADIAAFLEGKKAQNDPAPASAPAPRAGRPRRR